MSDDKVLVPINASIAVTYNRPKGPKILTQVPQAIHHVRQEVGQAVQRFDLLFAIDTSIGERDGVRIAATAVVLAQWFDEKATVHFSPVNGLEVLSPVEAAENIGWMHTIDRIQRNPDRNSIGDIGIIVDSDLSNLEAFNRRTKPVVWDKLLPVGTQFIYASADSGNENLPNQLIKAADRAAKDLLRHVLASGSAPGLRAIEGMPFSHLRVWDFEGDLGANKMQWTLSPEDEGG
jgi:hypothetical protein